jgi:hypothetical protein
MNKPYLFESILTDAPSSWPAPRRILRGLVAFAAGFLVAWLFTILTMLAL